MRNRGTACLLPMCFGTMTIPLGFPVQLEAAAGFQTEAWTTRPAYQIDDPEGTDGGFGGFTRLRVGGNGAHIVVQDAEIVEAILVWKIQVYSREGVPLVTLTPEDFPAGLSPSGIRADADGFRVGHLGGSRRYSYDNANLIDTVMYPPDLRRVTPLDDGGFLTLGDVPRSYDPMKQNPPPREQAVLRLADAGDDSKHDTLVVLDIRHRTWFAGIRGQGSRFANHVFSVSQPFSDHDLTWFDAESGSVGVVRRNGAAGAVEVFEVVAPGDTVWHRRFLVPAVSLSSDRAEGGDREEPLRCRIRRRTRGTDPGRGAPNRRGRHVHPELLAHRRGCSRHRLGRGLAQDV